ncbi:GNAT family N-acetyltransferase [Mesobacillus subterraneus]|nr:GNAT family N-acetyltransferase [Mesobacillus subterraneus]
MYPSMSLIWSWKEKATALQIGTVMTHPDYRHQGLSARLMNHVLDVYHGKYDFMYLFANSSVLEFYPKFGFELVEEYQYTASGASVNESALRKLNVARDIELIQRLVYERVLVSRKFSTANSGGITMYHVLNVFNEHLYYHDEEDAVVMFSKENDVFHLYDVISRTPVNLKNILEDAEADVVFHLTPDGMDFELSPYKRDGAFFVKKGSGMDFPFGVKHPVTSEA